MCIYIQTYIIYIHTYTYLHIYIYTYTLDVQDQTKNGLFAFKINNDMAKSIALLDYSNPSDPQKPMET